MSPHNEIFVSNDKLDGGKWTTVPGTKHKNGDTTSPEAILAHRILASSGDEQVREVEDELGATCGDTSHSERNPLIDDVD